MTGQVSRRWPFLPACFRTGRCRAHWMPKGTGQLDLKPLCLSLKSMQTGMPRTDSLCISSSWFTAWRHTECKLNWQQPARLERLQKSWKTWPDRRQSSPQRLPSTWKWPELLRSFSQALSIRQILLVVQVLTSSRPWCTRNRSTAMRLQRFRLPSQKFLLGGSHRHSLCFQIQSLCIALLTSTTPWPSTASISCFTLVSLTLSAFSSRKLCRPTASCLQSQPLPIAARFR
mmetsp:Transcript_85461/g.151120  ORF Transcript_85461/g.151120 Transcript_85461/m.151120 type:complete len:230 (-) Transcript_85461:1286-1975(-)